MYTCIHEVHFDKSRQVPEKMFIWKCIEAKMDQSLFRPIDY